MHKRAFERAECCASSASCGDDPVWCVCFGAGRAASEYLGARVCRADSYTHILHTQALRPGKYYVLGPMWIIHIVFTGCLRTLLVE